MAILCHVAPHVTHVKLHVKLLIFAVNDTLISIERICTLLISKVITMTQQFLIVTRTKKEKRKKDTNKEKEREREREREDTLNTRFNTFTDRTNQGV